ncbi:MAG: tryptophan synthase subunit alpha [Clostridia bacterium]|nr:tryptophan synthase subunit alpha [Clostridia bacterium]
MNRITAKFEELKKADKTAFIGYVTAGDPEIEKTAELVLAMEQGGADIAEIGIPYSDPLADGPVIQDAALRAFESGICVADIFACVKRIREKSDIPLLFLVYYNTIFNAGNEEFTSSCKDVGIDGLIVPDLPMEERDELKVYTDAADICLVPLVAPTSKERVKEIAHEKSGFIYCVSTMGVTGIRDEFNENVTEYLKDVKRQTNLPIAVGFGISNREKVKFFSQYADGVIVGSAIVKQVYETGGDPEALKSFISGLTNNN